VHIASLSNKILAIDISVSAKTDGTFLKYYIHIDF